MIKLNEHECKMWANDLHSIECDNIREANALLLIARKKRIAANTEFNALLTLKNNYMGILPADIITHYIQRMLFVPDIPRFHDAKTMSDTNHFYNRFRSMKYREDMDLFLQNTLEAELAFDPVELRQPDGSYLWDTKIMGEHQNLRLEMRIFRMKDIGSRFCIIVHNEIRTYDYFGKLEHKLAYTGPVSYYWYYLGSNIIAHTSYDGNTSIPFIIHNDGKIYPYHDGYYASPAEMRRILPTGFTISINQYGCYVYDQCNLETVYEVSMSGIGTSMLFESDAVDNEGKYCNLHESYARISQYGAMFYTKMLSISPDYQDDPDSSSEEPSYNYPESDDSDQFDSDDEPECSDDCSGCDECMYAG